MDENHISPTQPTTLPTTPVQPVPATPSPAYPYYGYPTYPATPRIRKPSDQRDIVTAIVMVILAIMAANFSIYGKFSAGYVISYLSLLVCGAVYLRPRLTRITPYGVFCLAAAVAAGGIFLWHHDPVVKMIGIVGISLLIILALLESTGITRHDGGTIAALRDVGDLLIGRPLTHMSTAISAIFLVQKGEAVEKRRCGGALLGLLCALPVLLVLVPLLISADAAFEGLLRHTILDNMGEMVVSLLLGILLFCLIYSRVFGLRYNLERKATAPTATRKGVAAMGINAFLGTIGGVYIVYLLSQMAYFFSAFSGILPEEFTVAEYARRGFFEMTAICAINLLLVAVCLWLSRKQEKKAPLSTRLLALFILVFSIGLVCTALSKMGLYIRSFGMTRLRILTAVFMVMLAAVLVFVIIRLFADHFPYMKATVITVSLIGLLVGYADVDTFIARYNVTAYEQGALKELDLETLEELSDGAVPYLVALWDDRTEDNEQELNDILFFRLYDYWERDYDNDTFYFDQNPDFRGYNVDNARARALLLERAEKIMDIRTMGEEKSNEWYEPW